MLYMPGIIDTPGSIASRSVPQLQHLALLQIVFLSNQIQIHPASSSLHRLNPVVNSPKFNVSLASTFSTFTSTYNKGYLQQDTVAAIPVLRISHPRLARPAHAFVRLLGGKQHIHNDLAEVDRQRSPGGLPT